MNSNTYPWKLGKHVVIFLITQLINIVFSSWQPWQDRSWGTWWVWPFHLWGIFQCSIRITCFTIWFSEVFLLSLVQISCLHVSPNLLIIISVTCVRIHSMLTIYRQTPLFLLEPLMSPWHCYDLIYSTMTYDITTLWHHYDFIYSTMTSFTPLWHHPQNTINTLQYHSSNLTCSYLVHW